MMDALLEITGLSKTFGSVRALQDVDFMLRPGEIHGLLGRNGSGKSTLVKVLAGYHHPDPGPSKMAFRGTRAPLPVTRRWLRENGIAFVHQDLGLVDTLTVWENLLIGRFDRGVLGMSPRSEQRRASDLLALFDSDISPQANVADLSDVGRAEVAILRAFGDPSLGEQRLIVLDEPTVYLPSRQVGRLFELIRQVADSGAAVVLVSHKLGEIKAVTDRVTVLRDGQRVATLESAGASEEELIELILGRPLGDLYPDAPTTGESDARYSVRALRSDRLGPFDFTLRAGEILGLTGLVGAGHEEVPYLLFGSRAGNGAITIEGIEIDLRTIDPRAAVGLGMALVPANRGRDAIAAGLPLRDNVGVLHLDDFTRQRRVRWKRLSRWVGQLLERFNVDPPRPALLMSSLSGGNQQKAVLAKWLAKEPAVLLLHEPTQGIDIGAKKAVFETLQNAARAGAGVLIASVEYEELAHVCDRVLVLSDGRLSRELPKAGLTADAIEEACLRPVSELQRTTSTQPLGAPE